MGYNIHVDGEPGEQRNLRLWQNVPEDGHLEKEGGRFMKKNPQGKRWHRLDNTGKIFPMIANENLSNVFRISVVLKHEIDPVLLQQALEDTLPRFKGFKVKLKRGFFWYYFEGNKRTPYIEKENTWPCRYIDPKSNQLYLFRVSYYQCRINLECLHRCF